MALRSLLRGAGRLHRALRRANLHRFDGALGGRFRDRLAGRGLRGRLGGCLAGRFLGDGDLGDRGLLGLSAHRFRRAAIYRKKKHAIVRRALRGLLSGNALRRLLSRRFRSRGLLSRGLLGGSLRGLPSRSLERAAGRTKPCGHVAVPILVLDDLIPEAVKERLRPIHFEVREVVPILVVVVERHPSLIEVLPILEPVVHFAKVAGLIAIRLVVVVEGLVKGGEPGVPAGHRFRIIVFSHLSTLCSRAGRIQLGFTLGIVVRAVRNLEGIPRTFGKVRFKKPRKWLEISLFLLGSIANKQGFKLLGIVAQFLFHWGLENRGPLLFIFSFVTDDAVEALFIEWRKPFAGLLDNGLARFAFGGFNRLGQFERKALLPFANAHDELGAHGVYEKDIEIQLLALHAQQLSVEFVAFACVELTAMAKRDVIAHVVGAPMRQSSVPNVKIFPGHFALDCGKEQLVFANTQNYTAWVPYS